MAKGKYQEWLEPDGLLKLEGWARDGLTNEQICENMGITRETLNQWRKKYSDISDTLKKGKEVVDRQVENRLFQRATGFEYDEVTRERLLDSSTGKYELKITKVVTKQVVPDTTAQIFWLKNRKPDAWRDKQDIGLSVTSREETVKELEGLFKCTPKNNGQI